MGQQAVLRDFVMKHPAGLHARPAALLVKTAAQFRSETTISSLGSTVSAKSILGVLSLAVGPGDKVTISTHGPDAADAMRAIAKLFELSFGEEDTAAEHDSSPVMAWRSPTSRSSSDNFVHSP